MCYLDFQVPLTGQNNVAYIDNKIDLVWGPLDPSIGNFLQQ